MSIPYWKRRKAIETLFEYEEANGIPQNERLTYDQYADVPEIQQISPQKKGYVDIRYVISTLRDLGLWDH